MGRLIPLLLVLIVLLPVVRVERPACCDTTERCCLEERCDDCCKTHVILTINTAFEKATTVDAPPALVLDSDCLAEGFALFLLVPRSPSDRTYVSPTFRPPPPSGSTPLRF